MQTAHRSITIDDHKVGGTNWVQETSGQPGGRWGSRLSQRKWPLILTSMMLATGFAFMCAWNPAVHHVNSWNIGGDLWGIFRGAHYVGWGFLGGIYTPSNGIITFPGMSVLLAPVAMLSDKLHLTESDSLFAVARPTAALILQPIELLAASTVVFATDALAERLHVSKKRRIVLCFVIALIAWPTAAVWGHAEDALAMTFAIYAMGAMLDRQWSRCGWLLGLGIVMQPLVALMLPLFIGATPSGKRMLLAIRATILSIVLVGVAFAGNASETFRALVKEPTPPSVNHATPWVALAPKLTSGSAQTAHHASLMLGLGHAALAVAVSTVRPAVLVAGGPGRSIDVIIALLFGLYVWRRPQHLVQLLWLAAVVLVSRCFFEAVMTPYYLAPPLFLALAMASRQGGRRFWASVIIAVEVTVFAYYHLNPWVWWLPIVTGLTVILALSYPNELTSTSELIPEAAAEPTCVDLDSPSPEPLRSLEPAL
jgi:hypothetical protein